MFTLRSCLRHIATRSYVSVLLLAVLPLIVFAGTSDLVAKRGPLWLSTYLDPSYPYLLNSLLLMEGQVPRLTEHPGTPVQVVGAVVIRLLHRGSNEQIVLQALRNPERYLAEINLAMRILLAAALFGGGLLVARQLKSRVGGMLFQGAPFLFIDNWMAGMQVTPETLLPTITVLYCAIVLLAGEKSIAGVPTWPTAALAGLLGGVGVATKFTFLPLLAFLLVVFHRPKHLFYAGAGCIAGLAAGLAPIYSRIPYTLQWAFDLVTHTGRYGKGGAGVVDLKTYGAQLAATIADSMPLTFVIALSLMFGIGGLLRFSKGSEEHRRSRMLFFIAVCQLAAIAFVAKHPGRRYMIPVLFSASLNAWFIFALLRNHLTTVWIRVATAVFLLGCVGYAAWQFAMLRPIVARCAEREVAASDRVREDAAGNPIVHFYSSSCVEYALQFASSYSGYYFGKKLQDSYPGSLFWNNFSGGFESFTSRPAPPPNVADNPVFFAGAQPLEDHRYKSDLLIPGTRLVRVWSSTQEFPQRLLHERTTFFYRLELVPPALQ